MGGKEEGGEGGGREGGRKGRRKVGKEGGGKEGGCGERERERERKERQKSIINTKDHSLVRRLGCEILSFMRADPIPGVDLSAFGTQQSGLYRGVSLTWWPL